MILDCQLRCGHEGSPVRAFALTGSDAPEGMAAFVGSADFRPIIVRSFLVVLPWDTPSQVALMIMEEGYAVVRNRPPAAQED